MLDSFVVDGLSEERLEGVALPGGKESFSFEREIPSRPRGMLSREAEESGRVG